MSNNIKNLFEFINKMSSLYVAPFHRAYDWNIETCASFLKQAFDDTQKTLDFGLITYQKCDEQGSYILLDGYQRLMTILIFVQALIKCGKMKLSQKNHPINFLMSKIEEDDIFKLKINNNDKNDIENIIRNNFENVAFHNSNFEKNYEFFMKELAESKLPFLELLNNVAKIKIINAVIDDNDRDEGAYFTLNKNFSQVDLIRNFVYKELKDSGKIHIFNTYWLGLENTLKDLTQAFLIDYLTIQHNGVIPKENELFSAFVSFYGKISRLKANDDMIKHIYRYAKYYNQICVSDIKDNILKEKLITINSFNAKDTYPYLMEVFEDYEFAHINKHMLMEILDTIISFIKMRNEKGANLYGLNFAELSTDINKMLALKDYTPKIVTKEVDDFESKVSLNNHGLTINDLIKRKETSI